MTSRTFPSWPFTSPGPLSAEFRALQRAQEAFVQKPTDKARLRKLVDVLSIAYKGTMPPFPLHPVAVAGLLRALAALSTRPCPEAIPLALPSKAVFWTLFPVFRAIGAMAVGSEADAFFTQLRDCGGFSLLAHLLLYPPSEADRRPIGSQPAEAVHDDAIYYRLILQPLMWMLLQPKAWKMAAEWKEEATAGGYKVPYAFAEPPAPSPLAPAPVPEAKGQKEGKWSAEVAKAMRPNRLVSVLGYMAIHARYWSARRDALQGLMRLITPDVRDSDIAPEIIHSLLGGTFVERLIERLEETMELSDAAFLVREEAAIDTSEPEEALAARNSYQSTAVYMLAHAIRVDHAARSRKTLASQRYINTLVKVTYVRRGQLKLMMDVALSISALVNTEEGRVGIARHRYPFPDANVPRAPGPISPIGLLVFYGYLCQKFKDKKEMNPFQDPMQKYGMEIGLMNVPLAAEVIAKEDLSLLPPGFKRPMSVADTMRLCTPEVMQWFRAFGWSLPSVGDIYGTDEDAEEEDEEVADERKKAMRVPVASCSNPECGSRADVLFGERPFQRCAACKVARYCSRDCQRSHWPMHKAFCKAEQAKRKGSSG